ncbi:MAG: GspE/PulE family protein [Sulfuricurvum sp.]|uniref:GspE/PulE family protein n=2 Tax=Sulfuricurvum sp. TaxID=2025608 RepID=UPI0026265A6D|nr:ATPase, T2SS/T4P/T4SS family [Sulfuricurvum sp.]MDD3597314.1 ATPase, T2SS/T4P/T4SS family [Sulfuricurvum sp.]MDD4883126.1 ATPase, T2SS/T4P/T4SS family [Sulfuricurvum sp.]
MTLIGHLLTQANACTAAEIEQALTLQKDYGGRIGSILLNTGAITETQLIEALAQQLSIGKFSDYKSSENIKPSEIGISLVFLTENKIFPFSEESSTLSVAIADPLKVEELAFLERQIGKKVLPYIATSEEIRTLQSQYEETIYTDTAFDIAGEDEVDKLKELASEAPVIKLVNHLFSKAVSMRASDIHFEAFKTSMSVRFRIDGMLRVIENIPQPFKLPVVARLKLLSKMDIAENRLPQDGRISIKTGGQEIDIRASSVPTGFGESFVLRLLGKQNVSYSLEYLEFYPDHLKTLRDIISKPNGIFLTTGPTGSGKTTTLYALLNELNEERTKIITVEDPVEYELSGISQIQVKSEIDFTFANALRSILRQDPDIIMIGEIRDAETAQIAIQSSLTGHMVLSTLHTNSALGSITRLLDMGMEFFLLKSSIIGLMAQRLVRRLCPHCKESYTLSPEYYAAWDLHSLLAKYPDINLNPCRNVGCKECNFTGFTGRIPIAEIAPFTLEIQQAFEKESNLDSLSRFGYRTLLEDGLLKALEGHTTIDEVIRAAG